ncbi:MAG: histidine kinase [Pseudoxanthomonas sp.]
MNAFRKGTATAWPAARRRHRRSFRQFWWLALYPLAWILLFLASSSYWFLPAGLRLALLWRLPRAAWPAMAALEWAGILGLSLWRGAFDTPLALLAGTTLPWLAYALVVSVFAQRDTRAAPLGGLLPRLLACGALAALANSLVLIGTDLLDGDVPEGAGQILFGYSVGDFIGVLVMAPALLALDEVVRTRQSSWRELLAYGTVLLPPAIVLLAARLQVPQPLVYALVLSLFPLFWVASKFGWRPAAISLLLLAVVVHGMQGLLLVWRAEQLQLLFSACAIAALLLGATSENVATQSKALMLSLEQLRRRGTDLVDIARRLTSVQEEERRRLGGELHDVLGQDLTSIATRLRVVERTNDDPALRAGLQSISQLVTQAHQHLREVTEYAYPAVLDRFGLARALSEGPLMQLARDAGMDYRCEVHGDLGVLHEEAATSLYRICQEATSNCVREPNCNRVEIVFEILLALGDGRPPEPRLIMRIHDDAGPVAQATGRTGVGLQNIRDRANALGAQYRFDPQHGSPRHWVSLPLADVDLAPDAAPVPAPSSL